MGAYYQHQVFKENGEIKGIIFTQYDGGDKYLESFYTYNARIQNLYTFLKNHSNKSTKYIVNTVCDYDDENNFKNQFNYYNKTIDRIKEIEIFDNLLFETRKMTISEKKEIFNKKVENFVKGYIVNNETEEYIDLEKCYQYWNKDEFLGWLDPLSLLTRFSSENQGGGDLIFDNEYFHFETSVIAIKEYIGKWKDTGVYFTTNENELLNHKNITPFLMMYEKRNFT